MRNDAKIDGRKVVCPNVKPTGYGKITAHKGCVIRWRDYAGIDYYGRMAGRVHFAPGFADSPVVRDWLLVVALGDNLTFITERWVNPLEVVEIFDPQSYGDRDFAKFFAFFFGREFAKQSPHELRAWSSSGYYQFKDYTKNKGK